MTRAQAAPRESWSHTQQREQHQHAHCAQQTRPSLLSRIAGHACTPTAPRLSVRTVLRVVAVDLLRPCRLASDRVADGLHERCGHLVAAVLQHDQSRVTVCSPDAEGAAPQPSLRRPRQQRDLVTSLNRHLPSSAEPKGLLCVFALGCSTVQADGRRHGRAMPWRLYDSLKTTRHEACTDCTKVHKRAHGAHTDTFRSGIPARPVPEREGGVLHHDIPPLRLKRSVQPDITGAAQCMQQRAAATA